MDNRRITALELFLTGIFLVSEFYFVWPYSHVFAWRLATITVAGTVAIIFPWLFGVPTAVFILLLGFATTDLLPPMPLPQTENHRWLLPAKDPTPSDNACAGAPVPAGGLLVMLGERGAATIVTGQRSVILLLPCGPAVSIVRDQSNRILLDATVRNADNNIMVQITKNEAHIVAQEISYPEEPDDSTIIVHARNGLPVFYVRYMNPTTLKIRGIFTCGARGSLVITDDSVSWPTGQESGTCFNPAPGAEGAFELSW